MTLASSPQQCQGRRHASQASGHDRSLRVRSRASKPHKPPSPSGLQGCRGHRPFRARASSRVLCLPTRHRQHIYPLCVWLTIRASAPGHEGAARSTMRTEDQAPPTTFRWSPAKSAWFDFILQRVPGRRLARCLRHCAAATIDRTVAERAPGRGGRTARVAPPLRQPCLARSLQQGNGEDSAARTAGRREQA
jgi:hypothetical protein